MIANVLRIAARTLWKDRGFSLAVIGTLGIGVGATLAVFAVIQAVLLRPLPYPEAGRLVAFQHHDRRTGIVKDFVALGDMVDLSTRAKSLSAIGTYGSFPSSVTVGGEL